MAYEKTDLERFKIDPFADINKSWMLVSAKKKDGSVNTMTVSWGGLGVLWQKNVATVYIRPQRYTKEFVDESDYFTITLFDGHKKELGVLGKKSGRDGDKIREVGFHAQLVDGQPAFAEGRAVLVCRKIYHGHCDPADILDKSVIEDFYPEKDFHDIYIGEIVGVYENK